MFLFQKYQYYLDRLTPYTSVRWVIAVLYIISFLARVYVVQASFQSFFTYSNFGLIAVLSIFFENLLFKIHYLLHENKFYYYYKSFTSAIKWNFQGFYIVTYAVGIYYLNLFLLFLTPSIDPALEFDDGWCFNSFFFLK